MSRQSRLTTPGAQRVHNERVNDVPKPAADLVVTVGIATFRRPRELSRVLPAVLDQLDQLVDPANPVVDGTACTTYLVVVDNDPDAGARSSVISLRDQRVIYVHQPEPGISSARNASIDKANELGTDVLLFLDDDEVPQDLWISHLILTWLTYRCAVVTGPLETVFDVEPEPWVKHSGVFETPVRPTGTVCPGAATNNVLYDMSVLNKHGLRFDVEFGLSGGSDTMLAHALRAVKEEIRWCAEAVVTDYIPQERISREWVYQRVIRTSNTWSRTHLALTPPGLQSLGKRAELTARGVIRYSRGSVGRFLAAWRDDDVADAQSAMQMASGIGLISGARGVVRYEYNRT